MSDGLYPIAQPPLAPPIKRRVVLPLALFLLTVLSTLYVGGEMQRAYDQDHPTRPEDTYAAAMHLSDLLDGWPFAITLLGILLAHELGHFFAARHYGIVASYPYFIPAPTLIGTMGAFIRIQSPIWNRRALFDIGISGPLVGFVLAVPALAFGLMHSRVVPATQAEGNILLGDPPLVWAMSKLIWSDAASDNILLHPVAFAAWVGLFATALNLLPVGQLDGGHIVYAVAPRRHAAISRGVRLVLLLIGLPGFLQTFKIASVDPSGTSWAGWFVWGFLLLLLGVRHPPVVDPYEPLDPRRRFVALIGFIVFLLCFTPIPFRAVQP